MLPESVRLFNPKGADRVAVISVRPSLGREAGGLIQVARGKGPGKLSGGTAYGPFSESELPDRFEQIIAALRAEGFGLPGLPAMLDALQSGNSAVRARAAARLGWRRSTDAVGPLLDALPGAVDDVCAILDALGAIGDPRAIPAVREQAGRKLLSRRRSAVEALRRLEDTEGVAEAQHRALESLPPSVRQALEACDPNTTTGPAFDALAKSLNALDKPYAALAADTLYEIGTPPAVQAAVRFLLEEPFAQPFVWRYAKSVFKRSMLRHDFVTFGRFAHAIEAQGRSSKGVKAPVKSGYDGVQRMTPIFYRKTRNFLRRLGWRYLRSMAAYRPDEYAFAAAEAIAPYTPNDAEEPIGLRGEFARCYLLHRILFGASTRFEYDDRRLTFHFRNAKVTKAPSDHREEAYPDLWDAQPRAYLRVLGAAWLPEAQAFAVRAVSGPHRAVLEAAAPGEILPMLDAPYEATVALAVGELQRRFDPARPDWALLRRLLTDARPLPRQLGQDWLRQTAPLWGRDPDLLLSFLTDADAVTAMLAAELAAGQLEADAGLRRVLAEHLAAILRAPETHPGGHDAPARLAREALAEEVGALFSTPELAALAMGGTPSLQALAGELLARRSGAVDELGLEAAAALAGHEVAAVRAAAHAMIRAASDRLRADPSLLFVLVESEWEDTRAVALAMLRDEVSSDVLGFDGLMGLLDSNRVDVQDLGRALVKRRFADLPARVLVERLVQHPHPNMRRFALDLVVEHLPDGPAALGSLGWFLRASVLDLWPDRLLKRRVIDFLLARGLRDEEQAALAARLLGEFTRLEARSDSEHALEALVRLSLVHPDVTSNAGLRIGGGV